MKTAHASAAQARSMRFSGLCLPKPLSAKGVGPSLNLLSEPGHCGSRGRLKMRGQKTNPWLRGKRNICSGQFAPPRISGCARMPSPGARCAASNADPFES